MKVEVLISCMYQKDASIIQRTNIQSDALVINQCDENRTEEFQFTNKEKKYCRVRIIHTTERGLSRSRNMAIRNAQGDICLICDDDEVLDDDYHVKIVKLFKNNPSTDVAAFKIRMPENYPVQKKYWTQSRSVNFKTALRISSVQIAFKRHSIQDNHIFFDEKIGSGVTKAGGEEKIFLHRCLEHGLSIFYYPVMIGQVLDTQSQWAHHIFTREYFVDWGYYARRLHGGIPMAIVLSLFFAVKKRKSYAGKISFASALIAMLKGIYLKK